MVVAVVGPPGSGQTTQSKALRSKLRLPVVSAEDLINEHVGAGTPEAKALRDALESGLLQRIDAVNDMVQARLAKGDLNGGFILDGYPRTRSQAEFIEKLLVRSKMPVLRVIVLEVADTELTRRLQQSRPEDSTDSLKSKVEAFRSEVDVLAGYFGTRLKRVNGQQTPAAVTSAILSALEGKTP